MTAYWMIYDAATGGETRWVSDADNPPDGFLSVYLGDYQSAPTSVTWTNGNPPAFSVAEPPTQPTQPLTRLQFRRRFTLAERVAIETASESNVLVRVMMDDLAMAEEVVLTDPDTVAGVNMLEQYGLIGPGRASEILGA